MDLTADIGRRVKWLLDNDLRSKLLLPLLTFLLGGAVAYAAWRFKPSGKRKMVD